MIIRVFFLLERNKSVRFDTSVIGISGGSSDVHIDRREIMRGKGHRDKL